MPIEESELAKEMGRTTKFSALPLPIEESELVNAGEDDFNNLVAIAHRGI